MPSHVITSTDAEAATVNRLSHRPQRTLARPVEVRGMGFLTGAMIRLRFAPAPPNTGIAFVRTDLRPPVRIPATVDQVTGTKRRTTLGHAPAQVMLVEHVLAALAGLKIDNCSVEVDTCEPPGLDGSSQAFVTALIEAGCVAQAARRAVWAVDEPVTVAHEGATLTLYPPDGRGLRISYLLDYGAGCPIDRQSYTLNVTPEAVMTEVAGCRTFLLEIEAAEFRRQGFGERLRHSDLLVFGNRGPIENRLRFANEPARHKVLDLIGDLSLMGADLCGHVVAYRSGHPLNVQLVRTLAGRQSRPAARSFRIAA
jgi:UDP-3-O-[3-hydroxymyristoyl] N-acetylglucosamine deacetylase